MVRPLFQIINFAPEVKIASGCMVMEWRIRALARTACCFWGCGVIPNRRWSNWRIALSTAKFARHLLGVRPRVAMLSFSTKGSASHESVGRVQAATALAQQRAHAARLEVDIEGELQVDAAIVPEITRLKYPDSKVAGHANVLIFPELNSGHITSRLLRHLARANAYGQILLGMDRPAADVSRGSTARDILGVAAIVGVQSTHYQLLYPGAGQRLPGEQSS